MPEDYSTTLCGPVDSGQGVRGRRWFFCPKIVDDYDYDELIRTCVRCGRFFARCCQHNFKRDPRNRRKVVETDSVCHHYRYVTRTVR